MIKAVLFDFGGVLSESGRKGSIRRIFGEVYGLDLQVMGIDDLSEKMWRGQISDEEFLAEIAQRHPELPEISVERFQSMLDDFQRSKPVYTMANELRAQGIKTGILSNVFGIGVGPLKSGGFYDGFDPVLLSCDTGYAKPDPVFYRMAIDQFAVRPEEIIFIDDQQFCLDPAIKMGMHVVLAREPEQIVTDTWRIIQAENDTAA